MSDIVISVERLSKRYQLGVISHKTLTHDLQSWWARIREREDPNGKIEHAASGPISKQEEILALKEISFTASQGEVLGIIGRNGAGKSTLLKILSRVTAPTSGQTKVKGRIASLLEVGTGFHQELTGRENLFLNGSILGMTTKEIIAKFDEIVEFAGIEKFIDTPVKRYSSGMYVRLAFAVAAHLTSDILLIDEVLAVGDYNFQKKCLGKIEEVGKSGRTVFFVSHSMPMVLRLCQRVLLLQEGGLIADGPPNKIVKDYVETGQISPVERIWTDVASAPGDAHAKLCYVGIRDENNLAADLIPIGKRVKIEIHYDIISSTVYPTAIIHVVNEEGVILFASNDFLSDGWKRNKGRNGKVKSICTIPEHFLAEGRFYILVAIGSYNPNTIHALERDVVSFQVVDDTQGDGVRGMYSGGTWPGVIRPQLHWDVAFEELGK